MTQLETLIQTLCPNGVKFVKLGEVGEFYGGLSGKTKEDFKDGNAKFITYKNIYSNLSLDIDVEDKVFVAEGEKQNTVQYGDVLFTGSSETPDECGMSSVLTTPTDEKLYLNSFCFGWRLFDKSIYLPDFLKHLFRCSSIRKEIGKTASGVTRFNVSKKKMQELQIPLPPLAVQSEIVRILDKFTLYKSELAAELAARLQQYEYYREQLLTFDDSVKRVKLGEVGKICMCKRILKSETNTVKGIPFYKIGTFGRTPDAYISKELFDEYKNKYNYPLKGQILISASGTIGRTVIFDGEPAYFQDSNIIWIDNREELVLNKFLYYYYQLQPWNVSTGGTIARLYSYNIENAVIPIPSLEVQERIVSILDRFDKLCNDIREGLPAEIDLRQKQYEHYRDKLLTFEAKG